MKHCIKLIVLVALGAGLSSAQENLLVNPMPTPDNVSGFRHSINRGSNQWGPSDILVESPGVLVFDNTVRPDYTQGVVRFELKQLIPGKTYELFFEARAVTHTGFKLMLPAADPGGEVDGKGNPRPKGEWINLQKRWLPFSAEFVYEPGVNNDAVTLFLPPTMKESVFKIRKCKVFEKKSR